MTTKQYLKMADVFKGSVFHYDNAKYMADADGYCGEFNERDFTLYAASAINSHDELVAENERLRELLEAAKAVVTRWDTPNWKDAEPTAAVIGRLRASISKCSCSA